MHQKGRIICRNGEYEEGKFTYRNKETYSVDLQKGFKYNILNRGSQCVKIGTFNYWPQWREHDMGCVDLFFPRDTAPRVQY